MTEDELFEICRSPVSQLDWGVIKLVSSHLVAGALVLEWHPI